MTMEVLQNNMQINNARRELVRKRASAIDLPYKSYLRRLGLVRGIKVGDMVKSWDLLCTLNFIERNLTKSSSILDIGTYASEVIVALHKLGYGNLTGIDLNPDVLKMPYAGHIRYVIGDFKKTQFPDASFEAITSISVIEHGFDGQALLSEISRLLKPGGYFIASFDYWPEKIDTCETKFFGMDWIIFSKQDVSDFLQQAAGHGLTPIGDLNYAAHVPPIECGGKKYTFGWLVLKKNN